MTLRCFAAREDSTSRRTKSLASSIRRTVRPGPGVEPVVADEDQRDVALLDLPADVLLEVGSDGDRVDVHEHPGLREPVPQPVVQARWPGTGSHSAGRR